MKLSLNWLKKYVDLEGIPVADIIHTLTMSGLEVEDVTDQSEQFSNIVVGYVKEKSKHPNADKLSVCVVNSGKEDFQVICGAPNVEAGQKVVFAQIGAVVPNGSFKITKAKIRGVESFGMICSEKELNISDNHSGIMVLPNELVEGSAVSEALGLNDVLLEIAITPNRPDALSHIGVARDLAALYGRQLKIPDVNLPEDGKPVDSLASVEVQDTVNCIRYSAAVVTGVTVGSSPDWLKKAVEKVGLRSINNIVDITNYVMYETGQPLHAFDLNNLTGNKIVVKSITEESEFVTLDSKKRKLPPNTLLICDSEKPVAVAGVMGGENSEVTSETKDILIESAYFNPSSVRRTAKALGLSTDASYRFERTVNIDGTLFAALRTAQLIRETAGGEAASGVIDIYPNKIQNPVVTVRYKRVEKLLGYIIEQDKIKSILKSLGFEILNEDAGSLELKVPLFRPDVEREADIIEEIARINGYDNIPTISSFSVPLGVKHDESSFYDDVRNIAVGLGFYEMINNPLQNESSAALTGNQIGVLNPQSSDMAFLRTSLIPGALAAASRNIKVGEKNLRLFEIGNTFNKKSEDVEIKGFKDFTEETRLLFLVSGRSALKEWYNQEENFNFYHLKGVLNSFISKLSLDNVLNDSYYHSGNHIIDFGFAKIAGGNTIGTGGKVKKEVLKQFDIQQDLYCFEFNLDELKRLTGKEKAYTPLLKYPKMIRDFAFVFDIDVLSGSVLDFIQKNGGKLLRSARLFDVFEHESLGEGKRSLAFELEYYSDERTLTDEEVEKDFNKLINSVSNEFKAILRGK